MTRLSIIPSEPSERPSERPNAIHIILNQPKPHAEHRKIGRHNLSQMSQGCLHVQRLHGKEVKRRAVKASLQLRLTCSKTLIMSGYIQGCPERIIPD
jgi:hypothetical protein